MKNTIQDFFKTLPYLLVSTVIFSAFMKLTGLEAKLPEDGALNFVVTVLSIGTISFILKLLFKTVNKLLK